MQEIIQSLGENLSLPETLKRIVQAAARLANAQYAALGVPDETGTTLAEFITTGMSTADEAQISHRPHGEGVLGLLLHEQKSLRLTNLANHPRAVGFPAHHPPMHSFLGVPILYKGQNLGTLYLTNKLDAESFTADDQMLVELLATHAGAAIQNAHLYEASLKHGRELEERNRASEMELLALREAASALSGNLSLTETLKRIVQAAARLANAQFAALGVPDETGTALAEFITTGMSAEEEAKINNRPEGHGVLGLLLRKQQSLRLTDLTEHLLAVGFPRFHPPMSSFLGVPILYKGQNLGTLYLTNKREAEAFTEADQVLVELLATHAGAAIQNARLYEASLAYASELEERNRASELELLALREAALALSGNLSLTETLKRIVQAAARLANAQYAALGVPDETGTTLAEFITTGMSTEEEAKISHRPRGHGVLGLLLREQQSLRLTNLADHPLAVGFPRHHPHMDSFLGVPIMYKGQNLGNLYLTNKREADTFTDTDQVLVELLATHAGAAIQNARLYETSLTHASELEEHNRTLGALNIIAAAVSRYLDLTQVMTETLDQLLALVAAEAAEFFLFNENTQEMVHALHRGAHRQAFLRQQRFKLGEGYPGWVAKTRRPLVSHNLRADERFLRVKVVELGVMAYACIPLVVKDKVVGCLGLAARDGGIFTASQMALLTSIGQQVGVAIENARLHNQVAQLAVLEDRQRIGMDLHDGVIQSIYAVGLTLELVSAQLADGEVGHAQERLTQAMEALNTTIRDIRSYILDLRPRHLESENLVIGLKRLLAEFKANTLMEVDFTAEPEVEATLGAEARLALFHIAQEALSNTARHSRATRIKVALRSDKHHVRLVLQDNGRGFAPEATEQRLGHGLVNMRDRVANLGGQITFNSPPGQGTEIIVLLPKKKNNGIGKKLSE